MCEIIKIMEKIKETQLLLNSENSTNSANLVDINILKICQKLYKLISEYEN
jgi:hypothetical protein